MFIFRGYWYDNDQRVSRRVMEEHLGRPLLSSEIVHHKNEDTLDDSIENLELLTTKGEHTSIHCSNKSRHAYTKESIDKCKETIKSYWTEEQRDRVSKDRKSYFNNPANVEKQRQASLKAWERKRSLTNEG